MATHTLDVTVIEPRFKHSTIYEHFDALNPGESFIIHNDHDPKPLYYALLSDKGNIFSWNYVQQGPEVWEVEIGRNA
jgi:regulator of cell morphogenesis and NO signaling